MSETKEAAFLVPYPVRAFLDVSTAHLTADTHRWLDAMMDLSEEQRLLGSSAKTANGWLVHAPENLTGYDLVPRDLLYVLSVARERKCEYVLFDRDAAPDSIKEFPNYEENPGADIPGLAPLWRVKLCADATDTLVAYMDVRARTGQEACVIAEKAAPSARIEWKVSHAGEIETVEALDVAELTDDGDPFDTEDDPQIAICKFIAEAARE